MHIFIKWYANVKYRNAKLNRFGEVKQGSNIFNINAKAYRRSCRYLECVGPIKSCLHNPFNKNNNLVFACKLLSLPQTPCSTACFLQVCGCQFFGILQAFCDPMGSVKVAQIKFSSRLTAENIFFTRVWLKLLLCSSPQSMKMGWTAWTTSDGHTSPSSPTLPAGESERHAADTASSSSRLPLEQIRSSASNSPGPFDPSSSILVLSFV